MKLHYSAHYFLILFIFIFSNTFAQQKKELKYSGFFDSFYYPGPYNYTLGAGAAMYNGDLCGGLGCNNLNLAFNAGANYRILPRIYVGAQLQYLMLGATDQNKARNLTFKSSILELTPYGRYYFIDDIIRVARDRSLKPKIVKPFFSLGFNLIYILSAKSSYISDTVSSLLPPEVSGSKIAFGIPAGLGIAFWINPYVSIVPEITYTYTFTDNLDNVSTIRGNPGIKDSYATFNIKLQFTPTPYIKKKKKTYGGSKSSGDTGGGGDNSGGTDSSGAAPSKKKEKELPLENKDDEKVDENKLPTELPVNTDPAEKKEEVVPEEQPIEKEKEEIK